MRSLKVIAAPQWPELLAHLFCKHAGAASVRPAPTTPVGLTLDGRVVWVQVAACLEPSDRLLNRTIQ